jgi:predicted deacylase
VVYDGNISIISYETSGEIKKNKALMELIPEDKSTQDLIKAAKYGTPLFNIGESHPRIMIISGIHGNELPPQLAALRLINELVDEKIKGSLFVIPFAVPHSTMENSRRFKGMDMNRTASRGGYASNNIIKTLMRLKINAIADFHSTRPKSNPGIESIFCSKKPCYESFKIANHMVKKTGSKLICYENAGTMYHGAIEDECNLAGIPAVTCEVVSESGQVDEMSSKRSYLQMISYLQYFNII